MRNPLSHNIATGNARCSNTERALTNTAYKGGNDGYR